MSEQDNNLDYDQETEDTDQNDGQETGDDSQDKGDGKDGPSEEGKDKKPDNDSKERNRQGFQKRQEQKAGKGVSREEFENLRNDITSMKEENTDLKFRNAHPEISDEDFNFIKAQSKGSGKTYDEVMQNPIVKNYLETNDARSRNDRATPPPSSRPGGSSTQSDWHNMPSDEFAKKKEEILRRG